MTVPLPIPADLRITVDAHLAAWPHYFTASPWPRSAWLKSMEGSLREHYPQASSDELTLTARSLAPFPLALPNVP